MRDLVGAPVLPPGMRWTFSPPKSNDNPKMQRIRSNTAVTLESDTWLYHYEELIHETGPPTHSLTIQLRGGPHDTPLSLDPLITMRRCFARANMKILWGLFLVRAILKDGDINLCTLEKRPPFSPASHNYHVPPLTCSNIHIPYIDTKSKVCRDFATCPITPPSTSTQIQHKAVMTSKKRE